MLLLEISFNHLKLQDGVRYYSVVTACSVTGLCTTVSSDGVLIDIKPPHIAQIMDGLKAVDIDYQFST